MSRTHDTGCHLRRASFLIASLVVVGHAAPQEQAARAAADAVNGRLSIGEKSFELRHVNARRMVVDSMAGKREVIGVALTDKALSAEDLSRIVEDYPRTDQIVLSDKGVTGLFLVVLKVAVEDPVRMVTYTESIVRTGKIEKLGAWHCLDFHLAKGRLRATIADFATEGDGDPAIVPTIGGLRFSYTAQFEATVQGQPLRKELEGASRPSAPLATPKPGTADGQLTVNGTAIRLKYAYAMRTRAFFDEPEEIVVVLITDHALSDEDVLHALTNGAPVRESVQGVQLRLHAHDPSFVQAIILHRSLESGFDITAAEARDVAITRGQIVGRASGEGRVSDSSWTLSVSFNSPFN